MIHVNRLRPFSGLHSNLQNALQKAIDSHPRILNLHSHVEILLETTGSGIHVVRPDFVITGPFKIQEGQVKPEELVLAVDVDVQACGGSPDFTDQIRNFQSFGTLAYWILYPKDGILVERSLNQERGQFGPPVVHDGSDTITIPGIPATLSLNGIL